MTGFFWKYFDQFCQQAGGSRWASGLYFLGRKGPEGWSLSTVNSWSRIGNS
jgi:hypothetical protein